VDRSGEIGITDIWFVAVKKAGAQIHKSIFLHINKQAAYATGVADWKEKVAASCIFLVVNSLFRPGDSIIIDKDYHGNTAKHVKRHLKRLFGLTYCGSRYEANPEIEFIPRKYSQNVRDAHKKSKKARYGQLPVKKNPDLQKLMALL
jgi:hypothetical protein